MGSVVIENDYFSSIKNKLTYSQGNEKDHCGSSLSPEVLMLLSHDVVEDS